MTTPYDKNIKNIHFVLQKPLNHFKEGIDIFMLNRTVWHFPTCSILMLVKRMECFWSHVAHSMVGWDVSLYITFSYDRV